MKIQSFYLILWVPLLCTIFGYAMEVKNIPAPADNTELTQTEKISQKRKVSQAIKDGDLEKVKQLINSGVDVNLTLTKYDSTPLADAIDLANLDFSPTRLDLIEFLIQSGANMNVSIDWGRPEWTALYKALSYHAPRLEIIRLLLGYGAEITEDAWKKLEMKDFFEIENEVEIKKIFEHHLTRIEQAKSNPTKKLLIEAIAYNKPYIVKLIVTNKPELVDRDDIELAKAISPYSVKSLKEALKIAALRKLASAPSSLLSTIPEELRKHIETIAIANS